MTVTLPTISGCFIDNCSYNRAHNCAAAAITIGRHNDCATFLPLNIRGGLDRVTSAVGACQRQDCKFNTSLECTAESVKIGPSNNGTADCQTFTAK